jgi:hypothetical protein
MGFSHAPRKEDTVMKSMLARIAMVAVGAAAMMVTMPAPAQADTDKTISLPYNRGYFKFIDDGDVFKVCDTKADGYGVRGTLYGMNNFTGVVYVALVVDDGGDSGCDKNGYNIGQLGSYKMELCWNGGGPCVYSEWFNE